MKHVTGLGVLLLLAAAAVSLGGPHPEGLAKPPLAETSNLAGGVDAQEGGQPKASPQSTQNGDRNLPESVAGLLLPSPRYESGATVENPVGGMLEKQGPQQVIIHLETPPATGGSDSEKALLQRERIVAEQDAFLARAAGLSPDMEVLGRVQLVLNAVLAEVDAAALPELLDDPAVRRISRVVDYPVALSDTVPYIGGDTIHELGVDGSGVRVAVVDTGVDYTHANLGGPGTSGAFRAAYGSSPGDSRNTTTDGLFPTAKVVGGYDFLGEFWPFAPLAPDPDPIDYDGHGTHVADIIGGAQGVAPGVDIYAVKVCASLAPSCSGVALILAMEFAVDPNGDGDPEDHVDIVNMSLGAGYGQPFDDDLSTAVDNATRLGVLTAAAAGNGGDRPYITSTPGAAASAISVAQTQVPSAFLPTVAVLEPPAWSGSYSLAHQPWSAPLAGVIEGPVQYGDGSEGNLRGCRPFAPGSLAGRIVVVDRGRCFFSDKIRHIQKAGGILGFIARVSPGPPFEGGFGGGSPITIPAYMLGRADGNILRSGQARVRVAPGQGFSLARLMVSSSSRGPEYQSSSLKPDIGAPGASVSAEAGTGVGQTPFGGTSGATPVVSGAAALLMQDPGAGADVPGLDRLERLSPLEVKAKLMNTAEPAIRNSLRGDLAPVSRIGGGEVRVDRAFNAPVAAWDRDSPTGALSFGFVDVAERQVTLTRRALVRNYSAEELTLRLSWSHRFADDAATGAVNLSVPDTITVEPGADAAFVATLTIDGSRLRENYMNSGPQGGSSAGLSINEYDGYLALDYGGQAITMPWHVLPRKAARLVPGGGGNPGDGGVGRKHRSGLQPLGLPNTLELANHGMGAAQNQAYSLLALSPPLPRGGRGEQSPVPDLRAVGVQTFEAPAGMCAAGPSYVLSFAVNAWERQTHASWPAMYIFHLDTDRDGAVDFLVFNADIGFAGGGFQARNVTWAMELSSGSMSAYFFTEHATNTANTVLYVCAEQVGSPPRMGRISASVSAVDNYFGGPGDEVTGLSFAPFGERYFSSALPDVAAEEREPMPLVGFDTVAENSQDLGLLLFTNGDRGQSSRGGATADTEALVLLPPGQGQPLRTPVPARTGDGVPPPWLPPTLE